MTLNTMLRRWCVLSLLFPLLGGGCERPPEVVVYVALDQVFAQEILREFERESGINVRARYDTEATKTTGLVERLRRERDAPQCDVFWNNEILRTIRLAREGLFDPYESPSAADIPQRYRDRDHRWVGFAARARAVAYDPKQVKSPPRTHGELLDERFSGRIAMANPEFGTTGSHLAFLFAAWGADEARAFLRGLHNNGVEIVGGNSTSRDRVVSGQNLLGLTDTDDIEVVRRRGVSIGCALYEGEGTVLLPNTVALVKGARNRQPAERLIDFLLSPAVEERLARSPSRQIPLRESVPVPEAGLRLSDVRVLDVSFEAAADQLDEALRAARELLR